MEITLLADVTAVAQVFLYIYLPSVFTMLGGLFISSTFCFLVWGNRGKNNIFLSHYLINKLMAQGGALMILSLLKQTPAGEFQVWDIMAVDHRTRPPT